MASVRYIVTNVEQAVEFYTNLLGFAVAEQYGPAMAIVTRDDLSPVAGGAAGVCIKTDAGRAAAGAGRDGRASSLKRTILNRWQWRCVTRARRSAMTSSAGRAGGRSSWRIPPATRLRCFRGGEEKATLAGRVGPRLRGGFGWGRGIRVGVGDRVRGGDCVRGRFGLWDA